MHDPWVTTEENNPSVKLRKEISENVKIQEMMKVFSLLVQEANSSSVVGQVLNFLITLESFMIDNQNKKYFPLVLPKILLKLYDFSALAENSIPLLVQLIRIETQALNIVKVIPSTDQISHLFVGCINASIQQKAIISISTSLFKYFFSDSKVLISFNQINGFSKVLSKVLLSNMNEHIFSWISSILIDTPPEDSFSVIDPTSFFADVSMIINSGTVSVSNRRFILFYMLSFFKKVIIRNHLSLQKFIDAGCFSSYDKLFMMIDDEIGEEYHPLHVRLWVLDIVNKHHTVLLYEYLSFLCMYLNEFPSFDSSVYLVLFDVIDSAYTQTQFDIIQVYEMRFIECFILATSTEILSELVTKRHSFRLLLIDIISIPQSIKIRKSAFEHILLLSSITNFSSIFFLLCTDIVTQVPSPLIITCLLKRATISHDSRFCNILLSIFVKTMEASISFVKADGLKWLQDSFIYGLIDLDTFSSLLSNLVVLRRFDEVDEFILSLPCNHPLFSQSSYSLEKIVYGMNGSRFRPIRVHSLFFLIKPPEVIDPYNAWMLGNCVLDQFLCRGNKIFDFPELIDVGNRFIHPRHVDMLLEKPYELGQYCRSKNYDHFPLFQFYQGRDDLSILRDFKAISFWFKLLGQSEELMPFFKTDSLVISTKHKELCVNIDGKMFCCEVDCLEWVHVYVFTEDSFRSANIIVRINSSFEFKGTKSSKPIFSFAKFGLIGNNLLFIGPAIRLFSCIPKETSSLFLNGPGFVDSIENVQYETIITPYFFCEPFSTMPNSSMSKSCTIPSNCVAVPYFGFPYHFISMRKNSKLFQILVQSQNESQFLSMFITLMKIVKTTIHNSLRFWPKVLGSFKKCKQFVTKDIFVKALKSMSRHQKCEQVLSSLLFDRDMWLSVDNEILVPVLFEYFYNVDWKIIENFELFLTTIVLRNPSSRIIVSTLLKHHSSLPNILKYLISLLKISHVLESKTITWDLLLARFNNPVQQTILDCLISFLSPPNEKLVMELLPFNKLRLLLIVSSKEIMSSVFVLMSKIEQANPGYICVDNILQYSISSLSSELHIWSTVFELTTGTSSFGNLNAKEPKFLPLVLILVWAISLCYSHSISYNKIGIEKLEVYRPYYFHAISICNANIKYISQSQQCLSIMFSWFPLIISYPKLLQTVLDSFSETKDIDSISITDLSEACDPIWIGKEQVIKSIKLPPPPPPPSSTVFVVELLYEVLRNHNFDITVHPDFNINLLGEWIAESDLFIFVINLICQSNHTNSRALFMSFFLAVPFYDRTRSQIIIPKLMKTFLNISSKQIVTAGSIDTILLFSQFFVSSRILSMLSIEILESFFAFYRALLYSDHQCDLNKSYINANSIVFGLILNSKSSDFERILALLIQFNDVVTVLLNYKKMTKSWLYLLSIFSYDNFAQASSLIETIIDKSKLDLKEKGLLQSYKNDPSFRNTEMFQNVEKNWIEKSNEFTDAYTQLSGEIVSSRGTFVKDFSFLSKCVNKERYKANSKHYLTAHLFSRKLLTLESTFSLKEERFHWAQLIISIRDDAADISQFSPKSYYITPKCFPYHPHKLVSPSRFPVVDMSIPDHRFSSPVVDLFRQHSDSLFSTRKISDVPLIELFKRTSSEHGHILSIVPCRLIRYQTNIKSVLFIFSKVLMILTYATIISNGCIELLTIDDEKSLHIFLESVFMGHWGSVSLFSSHIVIYMNTEQIIHSRILAPSVFEIWTFKNGHFILKVNKHFTNKVIHYFEDINKTSQSQLSNYCHLFKKKSIQEAYLSWRSLDISTDQFLLVVNAYVNRSFVDLNHYPFFPSFKSNEARVLSRVRKMSMNEKSMIPDSSHTIYSMRRILPFAYYYKKINDSRKIFEAETPASLYYTTEFYKDMNGLGMGDAVLPELPASYMNRHRDGLESSSSIGSTLVWITSHFGIQTIKNHDINENTLFEYAEKPYQTNIGYLDGFHVCQQTNRECKSHQTLLFERDTVRKIRNLSARLEQDKPYFIKIDQRRLTLSILDKETKKRVFCTVVDSYLAFACSLSLSVNGMFLVVDFEFGLSRSYRILYENSLPNNISVISDFSWSGKPLSVISGIDWIVATARKDHVLLWDLFSSSVHRDLLFNENIEAVAMDEENSSLWIVTATVAYYFSINGELLAKTSMPQHVTSLFSIPLPPTDRSRVAIIGCSNGQLFLVSPRIELCTIEIKQLPSEHHYAVNRLVCHPSLKQFLSIDKEGISYVWNAIGLTSISQKPKLYIHCSSCSMEAKEKCSLCNRAFCSHCMSQVQKKTCSHCLALSLYL